MDDGGTVNFPALRLTVVDFFFGIFWSIASDLGLPNFSTTYDVQRPLLLNQIGPAYARIDRGPLMKPVPSDIFPR